MGAVGVIAPVSPRQQARGAIWVITCGPVLCPCACGVFWWVLCQWLSHRARAVKAPFRSSSDDTATDALRPAGEFDTVHLDSLGFCEMHSPLFTRPCFGWIVTLNPTHLHHTLPL